MVAKWSVAPQAMVSRPHQDWEIRLTPRWSGHRETMYMWRLDKRPCATLRDPNKLCGLTSYLSHRSPTPIGLTDNFLCLSVEAEYEEIVPPNQ